MKVLALLLKRTAIKNSYKIIQTLRYNKISLLCQTVCTVPTLNCVYMVV